MACASEAVGEAENKPLDVEECLTNIFNALSWDVAYRSITMKEVRINRSTNAVMKISLQTQFSVALLFETSVQFNNNAM